MANETAPSQGAGKGEGLPGRAAWQERVDAGKGAPAQTLSGLPLRPLYDPSDLSPGHFEEKEGYPGEFP